MNGRIGTLFLITTATVALCSISIAETYAPPAPAPSHSAMNAVVRPFPIGPADLLDRPRPISGKMTIFARPPKEVAIAVAEIFVDGSSIGRTTEQPYKLEYDVSGLANGEHIFKAVGLNTESKEVWSASAKGVIGAAPVGRPATPPGANAQPPTDNRPSPKHRPERAPAPSATSGGPVEITAPTQGPDAGSAVSSTPGSLAAPTPNLASESAGMSLNKLYKNAALCFSISYPQMWSVSDKTAEMKPKQKGNSWVVFGTDPVDKAAVVVNLRRTEIDPATDADMFAKYNSYVREWKRTTLLGSPAFVTTDGKPENKRVIHRAIIIKDGCAWMLNCIDTTGKPDSESRKILNSMIDSLSTLKPAVPSVTITESKNPK